MKITSRKDARTAGLLYYFTGKPCKYGHIEERYAPNGGCKQCRRESVLEFRSVPENLEKVRKSSKLWKIRNAEKLRQKRIERWANDADFRQRTMAYINANRERYRSYYRLDNASPEKAKKLRAAASKKSGVRRGAEGYFSADDISRILKMQNYKCAWCRKSLRNGHHVDHILPIAKGGTNWPKNLQCLCPTCNLSKGAKHPIDWALQNGRLV